MFQKIMTRVGAAILALAVTSAFAWAQYNSSNYMTQAGNDWEVGGTLNIKSGGVFSYGGVSQSGVVRAGANALSSGTVAVVTGLTTITSCTATIDNASTPGVGTSVVTYHASAGTATFYGWKVTNSSTTTLIAATGTETIDWVCVGT